MPEASNVYRQENTRTCDPAGVVYYLLLLEGMFCQDFYNPAINGEVT